MNRTTTIPDHSTEVVLAYIKALNDEEFAVARGLVNDDLKFDGVLGSRDGADVYFRDMEKMKFKYRVKKVFADGEDVCLLYDVVMDGKPVFTCGWYRLTNGKISSLKVLFDPRPILEAAGRK